MTVLTDEELDLQSAVRDILTKKVAPLVAEHERNRTFPWEVLPALHEFGYVRGLVASEDGGDGMSFSQLAILMEEAGRCWGSLRTTLNILTIVPYLISQVGSPEQKARFLPPLLSGARRAWFAMTEPDAGSDAASLRTTARLEGDHYVISGSKIYITNASHADIGIVMATVDRSAGAKGITAFIVDRTESDYQVNDIPHMPVRGTSSCELVFAEMRVPKENVLGEVGRGLSAAMKAINVGRLNMSMGAVGLSQAALEESITFVTTREQFGKPLAGFQLVQEMVVEIATLTQTSRLLGMNAARALDSGEPGRMECSMAKYYCGESANKAASLALQVHGGAGLMEESPVERIFRDAREATIPEGTSQIQILQMGRDLLGVSALR
ncbi:acyl-CoA dehydrogenase family protein [Microbacterium aerolatum]|uniref:acyl-CoA dehydrogenase family protein n=1 Tax=Microbacterium aerolatum TaxID=153731 RepID=UPI002001968A|nr:acyl-CoA dehydrogenase family protein [Microbacterium aerolatum]MCK3771130.1 acyl-CoA dehydrogenase family protein [Microbacterium aerolatum]